MTDLFKGDDAYHGGAFMLAANFGFYAFSSHRKIRSFRKYSAPFDWGTKDAYEFFLNAGPIGI